MVNRVIDLNVVRDRREEQAADAAMDAAEVEYDHLRANLAYIIALQVTQTDSAITSATLAALLECLRATMTLDEAKQFVAERLKLFFIVPEKPLTG